MKLVCVGDGAERTRAMISRPHRFHGHGSLRRIYQHGKVARSPYCGLKYLENPRRRTYRAAVVVSRKVHKSAVVRNRIRRRLYEQIRLQMPVDNRYDLAFLVYSDHLAGPAADTAATVKRLLRQAGMHDR